MTKYLLVCTALFLLGSCSDVGLAPEERAFNIQFKYGVGGQNELNTFRNVFTKDLVLDGTASTSMILSPEELASIQAGLIDIGFFSFPDTLIVHPSRPAYLISPAQMFFLKVKNGSLVKSVFWYDSMSVISDDFRASQLRGVLQFIRTIVEAKREYKQLPPARGGYL
ncbi:MAG: hypothetical protein NTZ35_07680 [Ignavibacteriales bacterium]|nr:hypothetical protein [Ignavibacteriales bacterium]